MIVTDMRKGHPPLAVSTTGSRNSLHENTKNSSAMLSAGSVYWVGKQVSHPLLT